MKTSGYLIVVTAHYSDESSLDLEKRECKDIAEVTSELTACKLEYESALSKELFKDESIEINIRVFELNKMFIPKLISSFGLENGAWGGWSLI
jgi:hypothetical protein